MPSDVAGAAAPATGAAPAPWLARALDALAVVLLLAAAGVALPGAAD